MNSKQTNIELYREKQKKVFVTECSLYGNYELQYEKLKGFRKEIQKKYIETDVDGMYKLKGESMLNRKGIHIDHHIISYLAPMEFSRLGWGGSQASPLQQLFKLSEYLRGFDTRLIYVALPNKEFLYPEWLDVDQTSNQINCPQWRKFLSDVVDGSIECLDFFSIFNQKGEKRAGYFRKEDHNLSGDGARFVAHYLAEYIKHTTNLDDIGSKIDLKRVSRDVRFDRFGVRHCYGHIYPVLTFRKGYEQDVALPYLCDDEDSSIAIFGDCNLQAYETHGAGIAANLAFELGTTIDNIGRKLVFSDSEGLTKEALDELTKKDIAVYVAFSSAPFMRTTEYKSFRPNNSFCALEMGVDTWQQ